MIAAPDGNEFKMNEFVCIIFSRRSGEPCAHGPTEQAAWTVLVQKKFLDRNILTAPKFFEVELRLKQIDHVAVLCGEQGASVWAEHLPLATALAMIEEQ